MIAYGEYLILCTTGVPKLKLYKLLAIIQASLSLITWEDSLLDKLQVEKDGIAKFPHRMKKRNKDAFCLTLKEHTFKAKRGRMVQKRILTFMVISYLAPILSTTVTMWE